MASYVAVQLYERSFDRRFRAIIDDQSHLRTFTFAHLSSDCILRMLPGDAELSIDKKTLTIDSRGLKVYLAFQQPKTIPRILNAVQDLVKGRRVAAKRSNTLTMDVESEEEA